MAFWLATIKDKALDEEQVICWTIIEAENEQAAQDLAWAQAEVLTEKFFASGKHFTRIVVNEVRPYELGKWIRPSAVCNRRHRGPDGEFMC